jgi:hypothetical protein
VTLVRPEESVSWELRGAWSARKRVALSLDGRCHPRRLEGLVQRVAATGAFVEIEDFHVPVDAILAVHSPSRLGDSTIDAPKPRPRCVVCQREVRLDRRTGACSHCLAELGLEHADG